MQYIRAVYVDAQTGVPATQAPTRNGPVLPITMDIAWKETTKRPTLVYGTVSDDADTDVDGVEVLSQEEFDKYHQWFFEKERRRVLGLVERERVQRTQYMPFTIPSSSTQVEVKIAEQPPNKPRQTWLSGASDRALAAKVKGTSFADELIAADDSRHDMDQDDWGALGEALHQWVRDHINAASQHVADIKALTTVEDVASYDVASGYWPTG